jgi:AcrR family transcriptional regulator
MASNTGSRAAGESEDATRGRGRPKLEINRDDVADAVAELFHEGGYEAVSIINTADKLSVSRATLYRTVPTKEDLLGILFERSTAELTANAQAAIKATEDPREQLVALIKLQAEAAITMRGYLPVFFGSSHLPTDIVGRWHKWSRKYETMWVDVIAENIEVGNLPAGDARIATRLVLGMLIWVSRWWRPREAVIANEIADAASSLLGLSSDPPAKKGRSAAPKTRQRSPKRT